MSTTILRYPMPTKSPKHLADLLGPQIVLFDL